MTPPQRAIVDYIVAFRSEHGVSPTVREIAADRGIVISTAQFHIDALVRKGMLRRPNVPSGTRFIPRSLLPTEAAMKARTETL